MKNVDEPYEKYYNDYKNDFNNDDELSEAKKKKFDCKQFELFDKRDKKLTLGEETKNKEESKLTELPKWLHSNNFKKARNLIEDMRPDTNNVKSSSGDKNFFNNLDKLINDMKNKETTRRNTIEKIKNIVSDLDQQSQKEKTVFQNKIIDVVYYLFNSLGISSKPDRLMLPKWVKVSEERFNKILGTVTKGKKEWLKANVGRREIMLDNTERLLKGLGSGKTDKREFTKKYNIIVDDVRTIKSKSLLKRSQNKMVKILLPIEEIVYGPRRKSDIAEEQTDTTDTSEESEESSEQPNTTDMP